MTETDLSRLKSVSGIGDSLLDNFEVAGYHTLEDLAGVSRRELLSITGVGDSTANGIFQVLDAEGIRVQDDRRAQNLEKLQGLLRELLYLDGPDVNHGVNRIINQRATRIERFIEDQLPEIVDEGLELLSEEREQGLREEFEEVCEDIRNDVGEDYIDAEGNITQEFPDIPFAQELYDRHQDLQDELDAAEAREEAEAEVFNDLYKFFNRYYVDGDFNPQLRTSNQEKYAIPYNGQEVVLHWVNENQYFVKQTELLRDYECQIDEYDVTFEVDNSEAERGNTKKDKYYLLSQDPIEYTDSESQLTLYFEYRPLRDEDYEEYGISKRGRSKQETIREAIIGKVRDTLSEDPFESLLEPDDTSSLQWHLKEFTTKHERDYFIHKDLKGFLNREREQFVKSEIIDTGSLEANNFELPPQRRAQINCFNSVASEIIDLLAQIEDFQRDLYEKHKFVLDTNFLITLDNVPTDLYDEILENEQQLDAWRDLYKLEQEANQGLNRFTDNTLDADFLENHESLMVDTKYFDAEFTYTLLSNLGDVDDAVDGLLIKGDNYHALNLLQEKYGDSIDCTYIDPPYNTGNDEFVYKDSYRHSSWLSMMSDRLDQAHDLLNEKGAFFSSIDDNEINRLNELLSDTFGEENETGPLVIRSNPRGRTLDKYVAKTHDYVLSFVKDASNEDAISEVEKSGEDLEKYNREDERGRYHRWGLRNRDPEYTRENRPRLYYPIYIDPETKTVSTEQDDQYSIEVYPKDSEGNDDCWRWGSEKVDEDSELLEAHQTRDGEWRISIKDYLRDEEGNIATKMRKSLWTDNKYNNQRGKQELKSIMGEHTVDFPKSVELIKDIVEMGAPEDGTIIDFFAGSGTTGQAVLELNADDDGEREYILVEMGEYFNTVLKPRIQRLVYNSEWEEGEPANDGQGQSQVVKYIDLETYDDSLNNIVLNEERQSTLIESREYLLQYLLDTEARGSQSLLNVDELSAPFSYELQIRERGQKRTVDVDLAETFNYILGLNVSSYEQYGDEGGYLVVRGRVGDESAVVVWRNTTEIDVEDDSDQIEEIIDDESLVYVNGDSGHPEAQSLDQVFKNRMWDQ